jgi:hypothetical protein
MNSMSDLALQLIAENKHSRATFLDLGNCELTEVPGEVAELAWLEILSFSDEWLQWRTAPGFPEALILEKVEQ